MKIKMLEKFVVLVLFAMSLQGQTTQLDLQTQAKNVDFSNATTTKPFKSGTVLPGTCLTGEMFFKTDAPAGSNLYACTATNVWTLNVGGGGGGGSFSTGSLVDMGITQSTSTVLTVNPGTWGSGNTTFTYPGGTVAITSLAISGATNASPIVVTVPSTSLLRNGDTVEINGVGGNTAANGTFTILTTSGTQFQLVGSTGNGNYSGGGTVAGTGNGTAYIYGSDTGTLMIEHASSAALVIQCSGNCVINQVPSPEFGGSGTPFAKADISAGNWLTVTDQRRVLSNRGVAAGQGITVAEAGGTATVAVDATVARTSATNVFTGANSFTAAARTAPFRTGAGIPEQQNCTEGDAYWQTDAPAGQNMWGCMTSGTPGTWMPLVSGASSRAPVVDEEFLSTPSAGDFGQYRWRSVGDNDPVAVQLAGAAGFAHPGVYELATNAVADSAGAVTLQAANGAQQVLNLGAQTGWLMEAIVVTDAAEDGNELGLRFGLSQNALTQAPTDALQVRYRNNAGCTTTGTDTGWTYETRTASTSQTQTSGIAIAGGQSVHIRIRSVTAGTALFSLSIDGAPYSAEVPLTGVPTGAVSPFFAVSTCSGAVKKVNLDYFRFVTGKVAR